MKLALAALLLLAEPRTFEVRGQLDPAIAASVALHGSITPFHAETLAGFDGKFKFKNIPPGTYTVSVFMPGRGDTRITMDVGPKTADKKGNVFVTVRIQDSKITPDRSSVVSVRELSIPSAAKKEYAESQKCLTRADTACAIARLERAVEIAPHFVQAWNHLGTIAYQTRRYPDAEKYFRKALEIDSEAYEPIVNLGGVLVTLDRPEEAYDYNLAAIIKRPHDALAQSQMGMTYLGLGKVDLAEKHLLEARRLDPGHFSHPQLLLAGIYLKKGENAKCAGQLEDFLLHHPDYPTAAAIREGIAKLRK